MTNEKKLEVLEEALNYYQDRTSLTNEDEKELQTFFNELKETILVTRCCDNVKNIDNETPLRKIEVLTNTIEVLKDMLFTGDCLIVAIKKIDKLIDEV